jgi:hypothetical protein
MVQNVPVQKDNIQNMYDGQCKQCIAKAVCFSEIFKSRHE